MKFSLLLNKMSGIISDLQSPSFEKPASESAEKSPGKPVTYNSVTIYLFEAKDLPAMDRNGLSDPFCKFRLGSEKFRSRVVKKTLTPSWMEQFDIFLHEYDSKRLEISVWDYDRTMRNELIGKVELDLDTYERGKTYDTWVDIKDKGLRRGTVHLSVCVNEKQEIDNFARKLKTMASYHPEVEDQSPVDLPFTMPHLTRVQGSVGSLAVNILSMADLVGVDPAKSIYCVLQLGLVRIQTHTIPKTDHPEWDCKYHFPVNDIHSVLEFTVMDRDAKSRESRIGSVAIPLLHMKRGGTRRLFVLKDKKLQKSMKSSIWLEFDLEYDLVKAAIQTTRPKENIPTDWNNKSDSQAILHKVNQIRKVVTLVSTSLAFVKSILAWDSIPHSAAAYLCFVFTVWFFQPYWLPLLLLAVFSRGFADHERRQNSPDSDSDEEDDIDSSYSSASESSVHSTARFSTVEDMIQLFPSAVSPARLWSKYINKDAGRSLVTNVKTAHEQARFVQEVLEFFAEQYEKIWNTLNFTVPWLSYFAMAFLCGSFVLLYLLPFRLVLILWGTWEFGKGFCGVKGFEPLAFLSRVHSKHEARMYAEIPSESVS
ncbi:hypothetical protein RvY_15162 [Ramazzottius varieornatus]|uniref:C2 domain-containing protein n=1 Tax=Ramazzottius varieornatus TaxID=947166 RepID=A0A1D1VTX2_RAMVA|nr:hypothetical protein RvY_15162 [Ramazzottius varieornatus]